MPVSTRTACTAVAAVLLAGGCTGSPAVTSIRPDMGAAVRTAAAAAGASSAPVRWELQPRCGPADEVLDGMVLHARGPVLEVTDRDAALRRIAEALAGSGLAVERHADDLTALRAVAADDRWAVLVTTGTTSDQLAVRASGLVDGDQDRDGVEVVSACG